MSGKIMKKVLLKPEDVLQDMPYFTFKGHYQSTTFQAPANQKVSPPPWLVLRICKGQEET